MGLRMMVNRGPAIVNVRPAKKGLPGLAGRLVAEGRFFVPALLYC